MIWVWIIAQLVILAAGLGSVLVRTEPGESRLTACIWVTWIWVLAQVAGLWFDAAHDNWGWVQ